MRDIEEEEKRERRNRRRWYEGGRGMEGDMIGGKRGELSEGEIRREKGSGREEKKEEEGAKE